MTNLTETRLRPGQCTEPGYVFEGLNALDDAMYAASCLCNLHPSGATIYWRMDPVTEEQYRIQLDVTQHGGKRWDIPQGEGWEPLYTITRRGQ